MHRQMILKTGDRVVLDLLKEPVIYSIYILYITMIHENRNITVFEHSYIQDDIRYIRS